MVEVSHRYTSHVKEVEVVQDTTNLHFGTIGEISYQKHNRKKIPLL